MRVASTSAYKADDGRRARGLASEVVVVTKQERRRAKVAGLQVMLPGMFELWVNRPLKSRSKPRDLEDLPLAHVFTVNFSELQ